MKRVLGVLLALGLLLAWARAEAGLVSVGVNDGGGVGGIGATGAIGGFAVTATKRYDSIGTLSLAFEVDMPGDYTVTETITAGFTFQVQHLS
jgi:hypothetical protein